ncbi:MAG: beta-N-acetylhexosaminidase [Geminicoccaceae bacterium]|nr:beta-N-acetylhexosaminidase [Geminicoccaceae bacterium]
MSRARSAIVGISGEALTDQERRLFLTHAPAGFILFQRNCCSRGQLQALTAELKGLFPDRWVPVLIDHEGGRVQRMKAPAWEPRLPAQAIGDMPLEAREEAVRLWAALLAGDLVDVGIDVDCLPVLDVLRPETTGAIGNRSFSADPGTVATLGKLTIDTFTELGVATVMKHLPGHGRATVDSHLAMPRLKASYGQLAAFDFLPFNICASKVPFAITAHIVFEAVDPDRPATESPKVIQEIIRGYIGFEGILISDDLSMKALEGPLEDRARRALAAGCDLPLLCDGHFDETETLLRCLPPMPEDRFALLQEARPVALKTPVKPAALAARLDQLISRYA